jgi:tRNA (guanine-N7-)-methyltransferase
MRRRREMNEWENAIEYIPPSLTQPLDLRQIFSRFAPIELDLGCGEGTFLVTLAAQNLERNFLGIERLAGRVRSVCRKAARLELPNVRVLRIESSYAVAHLLPAESITAFHLLFPDPWPKRRHQRRRTVTKEFLLSIHYALAPGGLFHIATDHTDYFREIENLLNMQPIFARDESRVDYPPTAFEQKFRQQNLLIHRLLLRKVSPVKKARAVHSPPRN